MGHASPHLHWTTDQWCAHLAQHPEDLARLPVQLRADLEAVLAARAAPAEAYPIFWV